MLASYMYIIHDTKLIHSRLINNHNSSLYSQSQYQCKNKTDYPHYYENNIARDRNDRYMYQSKVT